METLIEIWIRIGYITYWVGWLESMAIWNVSIMAGVGIGVLVWIAHILIFQILYWINGDGWIWNP